MRKRALLAIAFAGGLLNQPLPALAENESNPSNAVADTAPRSAGSAPENAVKPIDSVLQTQESKPDHAAPKAQSGSSLSLIEQIANNAQLLPEVRAYYLLTIASRYLNGEARSTVDSQYQSVPYETAKRCFLTRRPEFWDSSLVSFADRVSQDHSTVHPIDHKGSSEVHSKNLADETSIVANKAIEEALTTLHQPSQFGNFAKLNLYFVASRLFHKMGNNAGNQKCDNILDAAFRSAEKDSPIDEPRTRAAVSILNSMSNGIIPVHISDVALTAYPGAPEAKIAVQAVTEKDFQTCQKLKLRAIAMVDRLKFSSHVRRKAHRDLVLWYTHLGKDQLAEREKQTLFDLVGIHDDSILYPRAQGCGQVVWWISKDTHVYVYGCGMG